MPKIKFITPDDYVLNIMFTLSGQAFHFGGDDSDIYEPDTLVFHLDWNQIIEYYYGIQHINDIHILGNLNAGSV